MRQKIDALTSIRAIAAFLVLIEHSWNYHFGNVLHLPSVLGSFGVSLFFVLSGFIMCHTYANSPTGNKEFYKRRVARIIPVYWFSLVFTLLVTYIVTHTTEQDLIIKSVLYFTSLHAYFPAIKRINIPSWSIPAEVLFYILFPLLLSFWKRSYKGFIITAIVLFIISQWLRLYYAQFYPYRFGVAIAYTHPLLRVNEFLLGMAGYYLVSNKFFAQKAFIYLPIVVIIFFGLLVPIIFKTGFFVPFFALMLVAIFQNPPKVLKNKLLVYFGETSYSMYILHWPVFMATSTLLRGYSPILSFTLSIIAILIIADLSYRFIETPARDYINSR